MTKSPGSTRPADRGGKETILVVDDRVEVAIVVSRHARRSWLHGLRGQKRKRGAGPQTRPAACIDPRPAVL